jgi:homoserine dehydrogenase
MPNVEVLKFGSSVLRSAEDLPVAVDEIYRHFRSGRAVLAVVSAFEGETDRLIGEAAALFGSDSAEAMAAYVATGEARTAALLLGSLQRSGLPARLLDPREIALVCTGSSLESAPLSLDRAALARLFELHPILVLPGFYGIDANGRIALFGRGGSDWSALFLAAELGAGCRLLKDVRGVFDADPARNPAARRFSSLSWLSAVTVAGPLIQAKALRYAQSRGLPFEVGRPNGVASTEVGTPEDAWADTWSPPAPLSIALLGCGEVGRGVYERIKRYPERFEIRHVLIRHSSRHADVPEASSDPHGIAGADVVIECMGGDAAPFPLLQSALAAGQFVITANKVVVARHWPSLARFATGAERRLWWSAAVGGALPVLERLHAIGSQVREIRAVLNDGSSTVRNAADALTLLIAAAFGEWLSPDAVASGGIDVSPEQLSSMKLIARARRAGARVEASAGLESPPAESFLGGASGTQARIEIELEGGQVVRLSGQGAGRWPTTVSVLGDLHEIARRGRVRAPDDQPRNSAAATSTPSASA